MKKNIFIGVGVVVLVVIGGLATLKGQKPSSEKVMIEVSEPQEEDFGLGKIKGSLEDLFARGQSMECTYSQEQEGMATKGKIYVAGKKVRADFKMTRPDGNKIDSYMIQDGGYAYIWTSQSSQGTKMKIEEEMENRQEGAEIKEEMGEFSWEEMEIDYSCSAWREDPSYFTPPAQVEFIDLGGQMEEMTKNQCAACSQLPEGEAKDQCLESLNCN